MNTNIEFNDLDGHTQKSPLANRPQHGFSMVELGVVLLVISILIGGVLKGRELIDLSKLQRLEKDLESLQNSVNLYQDYYQYLPGDDPTASQRFSNQGSISDGNGNNRIDFVAGSENGENSLFWQHLRAARLLKIASDSTQAPRNPFGGQIDLRENAYGISGPSLVLTGLSWDQAFSLDQRQDDANGGRGRIRLGRGGQVISVPPVDDSAKVEVAVSLLP